MKRGLLYKLTSMALTTVIVMSAILASGTAAKAETVAWPSNISVSSPCAIVMEAETGVVLYSKNADEVHYPASITKIMTALLAIENGNLDDVVTFSYESVHETDGSSIARDTGEQMTLEQCLYGMMLESANECAYAIAEHIAGDVDTFVDMMNVKAEELGCKNTHFNNTNGLPDEDHYTTCYDMALIARAAIQNETFATITGTKSYTIPPTNVHSEPTYLNNHHQMLNYYKTSKYLYDYCIGGKTGYTTVANSTLVTYAKKDGMTLICVVMNATSPDHYTDTRSLFDYCFENFTLYNVAENINAFENGSEDLYGELGKDINVIKIDESGSVVLPLGASLDDTVTTVTSNGNLTDDGNLIGTIGFTYGDRYVGSADIIYEPTVNAEFTFDNEQTEDGASGGVVNINALSLLKYIAIAVAVIAALCFIVIRLNRIMLEKRRYQDRRVKPKNGYRKIKRTKRKRGRGLRR